MKNTNAIKNFYKTEVNQPVEPLTPPKQGKTLGNIALIQSVQTAALKPANPGGAAQSKFELNPKNDKTKGWARSNING